MAEQKTNMGEGRRALVSFFCMVCIFFLAALFYLSGDPVFRWASILPGLFGLLMLYSGVHALFASRTPPTTIVVDRSPLHPGEEAGVMIRQQGPVQFESLRANLVCERIERSGGKSRKMTYPVQENFFDSGPCEVGRMDTQEFRAVVRVPADAEPTTAGVRLTINWRIEVWGRVKGNADFLRPFEIEVTEKEDLPPA